MAKDSEAKVPNDSDIKPPRVQTDKVIKTVRKPRPLVEGINSPKISADVTFVKPDLTQEEQELISETGDLKKQEPRLLSAAAAQRATKKNRHLGKIVTIGIILLLLAFGGYKGYLWYLNRPGPAPAPLNTLNYSPITDPSLDANASGTPDAAANATSTMAASSTDMMASSTFPLAGGSVPTSTTTPVVATPTPTPAPQLTINSTPTGYLNVRNAPSSSGAIITQVHPGETYPYTATQSGWYEITLPSGQTGWVSGQYVTAQ